MKTIFKLSFLLLIVGLVIFGWFLGQYKIVRTDDGYHAIRNESWGFSTDIVDTRDWKLGDYWKNKHISGELARIKFDKLREQLSNRWEDIAQEMESLSEKYDLDESSTQVREGLASLKEETRKRYQALLDEMEKGDINMDGFKKSVDALADWADRQAKKIKENI